MENEELFNDLLAVNASIRKLWKKHPNKFDESMADILEKAWFPFWQTMNQKGAEIEGEDDYMNSLDNDEDRKFTYYELVNR